MIDAFGIDDFFHQQFDKVGDRLYESIRSNAVRADTLLNSCTYFALGVNQEEAEKRYKEYIKYAYDRSLNHSCPNRRQTAAQAFMNRLGEV
jgi:hypothetical protein